MDISGLLFRSRSRITEKRVRYDGEEVTMVTLNTQTDWDWLEGVESSGKVKVILPTEGQLISNQKDFLMIFNSNLDIFSFRMGLALRFF